MHTPHENLCTLYGEASCTLDFHLFHVNSIENFLRIIFWGNPQNFQVFLATLHLGLLKKVTKLGYVTMWERFLGVFTPTLFFMMKSWTHVNELFARPYIFMRINIIHANRLASVCSYPLFHVKKFKACWLLCSHHPRFLQ